MKIKLDKYYQNLSGVTLAPGEHDIDPALGQYLINHGHAVLEHEENIQEIVEPDDPDELDIEDLREQYEALAGDSPDKRWGAERLQSEIDDLLMGDNG